MTDAGNTAATVTGKGSVSFTNNTTFSAGSTVETGAALKFGSGTAAAEIRTGNETSPAVVAGTLSYAAESGLSVSEGTLANTRVSMNEDSRLTAGNVAMDAGSSITGGALVVDGLSIALEGGVTSTDTLMVNTVLISSSQEELTIRLDHEARVLSLECTSLNDVTVTGSALMFDFSAFGEWASILEYEYLCLDFSAAGADLSGVSDISVVYGDQVYEGYRAAAEESRSGIAIRAAPFTLRSEPRMRRNRLWLPWGWWLCPRASCAAAGHKETCFSPALPCGAQEKRMMCGCFFFDLKNECPILFQRVKNGLNSRIWAYPKGKPDQM